MSTQFGKYAIEKKLGQGGMGAVYLAVDSALNRRVALKIITSTDPELLERFQREAQAVAKLKHPNIVQVYEAGAVSLAASGGAVRKQHYFTMDYIEGVSLEKIISSPKKPGIQNIAGIIMQVALALHYAHSRNVIHRDIKPANIMIDKQGKAYITDFGLAKQLTGLDRSLTITGAAVGTPSYMSPEQAMGMKDELDLRSDIFSLGATFYHCITGRLPFDGKELYEVFSKVINDDPPTPSSVIKIIPKDLETICLKCLEKDKARRYQSALELENDIKLYLDRGIIKAKPASRITKFWDKARKNKTTSLAVLGAAVILIIVAIGLLVSSSNRKQLIARYRQEAEQEFRDNRYDKTKAICDKLLALSPQDEAIQSLLKKCEKILKAQETKKQQDQAQAKAEATKAQKAIEARNKAKEILDRVTGAPTPEQKIKLAEEALAIDPKSGDAYQVIGYAYKEKRNYNKAFAFFTKAIETTPTLAYSYYERAIITAYIHNKPDEAIPDFEMVLKYDSNSYIGWFAKGQIEHRQKQYDEALKSHARAIELYPECIEAYIGRGNAYNAKGELNKAIADYDEAIRLDPKHSIAYNNRGSAYHKKGDFDKAITDYDEAIRLNTESADAYSNRGAAYAKKIERELQQGMVLSLGLVDKAIADCNEAIRLNPNLADAYSNRGSAYYNKKELDKAIADFNEAIRLKPGYAEAYNQRGLVYSMQNELDKAMADYDESIRLSPQSANIYNNRANIYQKKAVSQRHKLSSTEYDALLDKAIADYTESIRLDPQNYSTYHSRGSIYDKKTESPGNIPADVFQDLIDKAIADFSEAIRCNRQYAESYNYRGYLYYKKAEFMRGKTGPDIYQEIFDKAIADFTEAISLAPKLIGAYFNRGGAYFNKRELNKAIADFEKVLELDPKHPQAPQIRQAIEDAKKQPGE
ncbi:MAG: tetratricopeptide repeat protein [Planctomycetota bacterium]